MCLGRLAERQGPVYERSDAPCADLLQTPLQVLDVAGH